MPSNIPFPYVPRIFSIRNLLKFVRNPISQLSILHKKYGDTFYIFLGGIQKGLVTCDPEFIKEVLQRQHRNFEKSELQTVTLGQYLGKGLLTNSGDNWLRQRRLIQPGFHKEKIENLLGLMMDVVKKYGDKIGEASEKGSIDIFAVMQELSFEIIARTLMSEPIPEEDLEVLNRIVMEVQEFVIKQARMPFLNKFFKWSGLIARQKRKVEDVRRQLLGYVNERRANPGKTDDLLDMLLAARYEDNNEPMVDRQLLDEMLILFVAGHETTANALSWAWYLLSRHQNIADAIRKEVEDAAGDGSQDFFNGPLTIESLKKLELTHRVVQETMRLYPPAWITDRLALREAVLGGEKIKKGELVIPHIYGLHHNPDYWPDPDKFDPDRFLPENVKARKPYTYIPFGGGPRFCIGNNFAMMEMQMTLAYLCYHFDFNMASDNSIGVKPLVTLRMDQDAIMHWKKRVATD